MSFRSNYFSCVCLFFPVFSNNSQVGSVCFGAKDVNTWQPGRATTFVLPVVEIEQIIVQLQLVALVDTAANNASLHKQISNWKTVLTNYRAHHSNLTTMFTEEMILYSDLVNKVAAFESDMRSDIGKDEYDSSDISNKLANLPHFNGAKSTFNKMTNLCTDTVVLPSKISMPEICKDFDGSKWTSFIAILDSACNSPVTADSSSSKYAALFRANCKQDASVPNTGNIPGGLVSSSPESMFGFLKDKTKYLTFGSNAPVTMSWTSTVQDSISSSSGYQSVAGYTVNGFVNFDLVTLARFEVASSLIIGGGRDITVNVGKTSNSDHSFSRTVTITLDDEDEG